MDRIAKVWAAIGELTFAETIEVASTFRDALDSATDFEASDARDWAFLINTAREIGQENG